MNEFRNRVIPPIDPWRVKHVEQHWIIGIWRHGDLDDPAGSGVQPRNRKMMREFIAGRGRHQAQNDLGYKNDENGEPKNSTDPIRFPKGADKYYEEEDRRSDKTS